MLQKLLYRIPKLYQLVLAGTISALVAISVGLFVNYLVPAQPEVPKPPVTQTTPSETAMTKSPSKSPTIPPNPVSAGSATRVPTVATTPESTAGAPQQPSNYPEPYDDLPDSQHNHLAYDEADPSRIVSIGLFVRESYEREEFLDADAAQAFQIMTNSAAAEGISLIPISGFRTIERQAELFAKQVEKQGSESAAAQLSAPPGHSEHHTGYAIDIGDANRPDADIKYEFENTDAYRWLLTNAVTYGFELSFPEGNQQGVSFEPWHWRYFASPSAAKMFLGQ